MLFFLKFKTLLLYLYDSSDEWSCSVEEINELLISKLNWF